MPKPDPLSDDDRKPVCPVCDWTTVSRLPGRLMGSGSYWRCWHCGGRFSEPAYREMTRDVDRHAVLSDAGRAAVDWEPEGE